MTTSNALDRRWADEREMIRVKKELERRTKCVRARARETDVGEMEGANGARARDD